MSGDIGRQAAEHAGPAHAVLVELLEMAKADDRGHAGVAFMLWSTTWPSKRWNVAVRVPREARVVRDHANRRALLVQLAEQVHVRFAVGRIEVAGRLVGEPDEPAANGAPRAGHPLLLAGADHLQAALPEVA